MQQKNLILPRDDDHEQDYDGQLDQDPRRQWEEQQKQEVPCNECKLGEELVY